MDKSEHVPLGFNTHNLTNVMFFWMERLHPTRKAPSDLRFNASNHKFLDAFDPSGLAYR